MFYVKNLPTWERHTRILAGAAMVVGGLWGLKGLSIGVVIAGLGGFTALTGLFGFCPACAMAGRKLKPVLPHHSKP